MSQHDTFDELAAAYALETLDREDTLAFERHLAGCATCQATVADLRRVSAGLGMAVDPVAPPPSLRARTLARATSQAQPAHEASPTRVVVPRAPTSWAWLGMAAAVVLAVGLGAYAGVLRRDLAASRQLLAEMSSRVEELRADLMTTRGESARLANTVSVLAAPDLVRVDLRGVDAAPAATGRAYLSARGLIFSASSLPPLGANRTYQLWVIPPGAAPISAGLFTVDPTGTSTMAAALPTDVAKVATVAVTAEPAGGSATPTLPILLVGTRANN